MYKYKWMLPSLKEILADRQATDAQCSSTKARQQWRTALAATEELLLNHLSELAPHKTQGLVLTAPCPVLYDPVLNQCLRRLTFTAKPFNPLALMPFHVPSVDNQPRSEDILDESVLPLLSADPLSREQFCLVFTENFSLLLVLAEEDNNQGCFLFSFDPEVIQKAWRALAGRVMLTNPDLFMELDELVHQYYPASPDYRIVMEFSQLLLREYPEPEDKIARFSSKAIGEYQGRFAEVDYSHDYNNTSTKHPSRSDVELLNAFAHEVRTPLTTIRTTIRLLLKRKDLPAKVIKHLQSIDRECTEQIDRMELLFRAAELETSSNGNTPGSQLTVICLEQMLHSSIPRWEQAANRRNLTLDVVIPQKLPAVVTNPNMLDRVLTGLMENFTRNLPAGSHIQVQIIQAGDQLKLQLSPNAQHNTSVNTPPIRKAIGQLLTFQPDTGTISLNLTATKHLFQAIGGKLIVRERPEHGEVLTIYLPLEGVKNSNSCFDKLDKYRFKLNSAQRSKLRVNE